jgi:hypothetical protein
MAIVFNEQLSGNAILPIFNNQIVRFETDNSVPAEFAEIQIGSNIVRLFPNPSGQFYYNFSEIVKSIMNSTNFADNIDFDIDSVGYVYVWTFNTYWSAFIQYKIVLEDTNEEFDTNNYTFLLASFQLEDFKKRYPLFLNKDNTLMFSPFIKDNNQKAYVRYWEGYPFDITVHVSSNSSTLKMTNKTNLLDYDFLTPSNVLRIAFSDGRITQTIDDVLSIQYGYNEMELEADNTIFYFDLIKEENTCGTYLKFRNSLGGWNYWLFPKGHRNRITRDIGELENDYYSLEQTISPSVQIGKNSSDTITVTTDILNENDMLIMEELIDSPKVYLFTGIPLSKCNSNDWLEISLRTTDFRISNAKNVLNRFNFQFDLPRRTTLTL